MGDLSGGDLFFLSFNSIDPFQDLSEAYFSHEIERALWGKKALVHGETENGKNTFSSCQNFPISFIRNGELIDTYVVKNFLWVKPQIYEPSPGWTKAGELNIYLSKLSISHISQ